MRKIFLIYVIILIIPLTIKAQNIHVTRITDDMIVLHPSVVDDINEVRKVGGNVTAVRTDSGIVMFDSFISIQAAEVGWALIQNYFPKTSIKYLINTHHHPDHVTGNIYFNEASIIAYENLKKKIDIPETIQIKSGAVLTFGGKTFEIFYYGAAHTKSDLVILDRDDKLLIMGDLLCRSKCYILVPGSDALNWVSLLNQIIERKEEYDLVIPGHGGVVENVNSLIEQRDYLQDVWNAVINARKKNLSLEETKKKVRLEKYKDYMLYDKIGLDIEACWNQIKH